MKVICEVVKEIANSWIVAVAVDDFAMEVILVVAKFVFDVA